MLEQCMARSGERERELSRLNSDRKGSQSWRACRLQEISCCCGSRAADPKTHHLMGFACRLCDPCMGRLRREMSVEAGKG
jgi:hypothetical protein